MYFLGAAANYSTKAVFRHLFAFGTRKDSFDLRRHLAHRYGTDIENIALTANGRSALALALKATVTRGSKVVVNGFTCHAVVEAVRAAGCIPIYADIDLKTLHYDADILKSLLKLHPDIKAIIIQNTLGIPEDICALEKLQKSHSFVIIEDLAHCTGVKYPDGREVGTVGSAVALSFGKGKSIDTITGGAFILRSTPVIDAIQARSSAPTTPIVQPSQHPRLSDTLRARWYPLFGAIARLLAPVHLNKLWLGPLLKLHFIERSADARLNTSVRLTHWQAKLALSQLRTSRHHAMPPLREYYFVDNRDDLLKKLARLGYHFEEIWYDVPVSPARYYDKVHFPEKDCPNAVFAAAHIINLPAYYSKSALKPAIKLIKEYQHEA